jgi:aryl carrier-like protein
MNDSEERMREQKLSALTLQVAGELLERDDLSLEDDFFASGGDSMLAMHLVGRLSRATGLRLRVSMLLEHPVLGDFATAGAARAS